MVGLFDTGNVTTSQAGDGLKQAWKKWCQITHRPKQLTPEKKFAAAYRKALSNNMTHDVILDIVESASYLPPRPKDPRDVNRFSMCLNNKTVLNLSRELQKKGQTQFDFPDTEQKISIDLLADVCGTRWEDWSVSELEYADILCGMDTDEISNAVAITREEVDSDFVLPSDIIRQRSQWSGKGSTQVKRKTGRRTHDRGTKEQEQWSDVSLDVDSLAQKMFLKGVDHDTVLEFHNLAPDGFWDMVAEGVKQGYSLKESAIDAEQFYDWDSRRLS